MYPGEWLSHYSIMRKLKTIRLEHLGIGLEFNFELVFDVVKSRRQLVLQVWSLELLSALGQRFGWLPSRHDSYHCGTLRSSPQAEDMKGKKES